MLLEAAKTSFEDVKRRCGHFRVVPPLRKADRSGSEDTLADVVEAAETQAISAALKAVDGNRREAAKRLGVSLRTLFYKMSRYGLE